MAGRGEVRYKLVLDAGEFKKSLHEASEGLGEFFHSVAEGAGIGIGINFAEKLGEGLREIVGLGPEAAEFLAEATHKAIEFSEKILRTSEMTHLGAEALQTFAVAARQTGTEFDQVVGGTSKLMKNLGGGSAEVVKAVGDLGLSLGKLQHSSPDEVLKTVLERVAEMPNPMRQAADASALLGKNYRELLPLIEKLKSGDTERLGAFVKPEDLEATKALGLAFTNIGIALDGMVTHIGVAIGSNGALRAAAEAVATELGNLSKWIYANKDALSDLVTQGVLFVLKGLQNLVVGAGDVVVLFAKLADTWSIAALGAQTLSFAEDALYKVMAHPLDAGKVWDEYVARVKGAVAETNAAIEKHHAIADKVGHGLDAVGMAIARVGADAEAAAHGHEHAGKAAKQAGDDFGSEGKAAEEAAKKIKASLEAVKNIQDTANQGIARRKFVDEATGFGAHPQEAAFAEKIFDVTQRQSEALKKVNEEQRKAAEAAKEAGHALSSDEVAGFDSARQAVTEFANEELKAAANTKALADAQRRHNEIMGAVNMKYYDFRAQQHGWKDFLAAPEELQKKIKEGTDLSKDGISAVTHATFDWGKALQAVAETMQVLGISADSTFGKIIGGMTASAAAGQQFASARKAHDIAGMAVAGASAFAGFMHATDQRGAGARALGGGLSLGSAAYSATQGMDPLTRALVTGGATLVGAIGGALRKPDFTHVLDEVSKKFGVSISDELAKNIRKTAKDLKIGNADAEQLHLGEIMNAGHKDMREGVEGTLHMLEAIKNGVVPAKEGMAALNEQFGLMKSQAQEAGRVGDAAMVAVLKRARELGQMTPEMKAAAQESLGQAATGAKAFMDGLSKTDDLSKVNGAAAATSFMAVFNATVKESGVMGAVAALSDGFAAFRDKIQAIGGDAASALLAPMSAIFDLAQGPMGGLVSAADGLRQMLVGVADAGYLDTASFSAMETTASGLFEQMVAGGTDTHTAIEAMAPTIQAAVSAAEQMGVPLSADMQHLKEVAEANGIAFKTDPMDRMVTVLEAIAKALGADIPENANKTIAAFNSIPTEKTITIKWNQMGGPPTEPGGYNASQNGGIGGGAGGGYSAVPGHAFMGYVPPTPGGQLWRIGEGGQGEWVVPQSDIASFASRVGVGGMAAGPTSVTFAPHISVQGGGDPVQIANAIAELWERDMLPSFDRAAASRTR